MSDTEIISVVVPVYNEQANVVLLHGSLQEQFLRLEVKYEIIFVDDGSHDRSLDVLREIAADDPHVKVVALSRNFGHQNAVTAGLTLAAGDAVVVMDADLQHPPELLPEMVARWREGYDVVYTIREDTADAGPLKRFSSRAFYWFVNRISDTPIVPGAADFRLVDRAVVDVLNAMQERARFLRGLVSWVGYKQTAIRFVAPPRRHGKSQYTFRRMLALALSGITNFSLFPLRLATYLGFFAALVGIPYALWAVYAKLFTDTAVPGWASLTVFVLFLGGIQLICLGIMGEYLGRVYDEVKRRPLFLARELIGFDDTAMPGWNSLVRPRRRPAPQRRIEAA